MNQLQFQLMDVTASRDALQKQLASVPPMLSVDRAPQVIVDASADRSSLASRLNEAWTWIKEGL